MATLHGLLFVGDVPLNCVHLRLESCSTHQCQADEMLSDISFPQSRCIEPELRRVTSGDAQADGASNIKFHLRNVGTLWVIITSGTKGYTTREYQRACWTSHTNDIML